MSDEVDVDELLVRRSNRKNSPWRTKIAELYADEPQPEKVPILQCNFEIGVPLKRALADAAQREGISLAEKIRLLLAQGLSAETGASVDELLHESPNRYLNRQQKFFANHAAWLETYTYGATER